MQTTDPALVPSGALARVHLAVLGSILIVVVLTGLFVWQDRRETGARAEERVVAFATVTEAYVLRRLRETESGMKILADMRIRDFGEAAAIREIAALHQRNFPFIEALGVVEGERKDLMIGMPHIVKALADWAAGQSGDDGKLRVGGVLLSAPDGIPVIPLWLRFANGNDQKTSVVVAAIRSDMLSLMHSALGLGPGSLSVLVDKRGLVLARQPFALGAIGIDVSAMDAFANVPADRKSAVRIFASPVDGRKYLLGMSRLQEHGLSVRSGELWEGTLASWRERTERSIAIAAILIVVVAFLGRLAAQRVREEERVRQAQSAADALYRNALSTLAEGVITNGLDGSVLTFNATALRILGLTGDQLRGLTPMDPRWRARREDGSDFPGREHPVMRVLATGKPQIGVLMDLESGDGTRRWIEINAVPNHDADGVLSGAVVSFSDVTAYRAALVKLEELNHTLEARVAERTAQLQQLGSEMAEVEDRERRQISRDLHDDIAQTLAAARIRLAGLAGSAGDQTRDIAAAVGGLIDRADASIRSLAAQLAPPALAEIGLLAGLEWLADEMDCTYGLAVEVHDDGAPKPLEQGARSILFRAVRELLINVSKHAGVNRASVECRCEDHSIVIEVTDEGVGFDSQSESDGQTNGLGLRGIRERLAYIRGSLTFATVIGGGVRAIIVAPLANPADAPKETAT